VYELPEVAMMDLIAAERRALADVLDGLTAGQWRGPTLCAGWTPGHVLAHLTMPFRISEPEFMRGQQRCGGDFTKFSDQVADADSHLPQAELVAVLRDNAETPWSPPGGGLLGALSHDVIHGLDITWPLSIEYQIPDEAMTAVLDSVISPASHTLFGFPLEGISLSAPDLRWSAGSGPPLAGRGRDLLLLLAGRQIPRELFEGDGAELAGTSATR
jgi:uncharacterized protein (TIGR03083 family)